MKKKKIKKEKAPFFLINISAASLPEKCIIGFLLKNNSVGCVYSNMIYCFKH